MSSTPVVFRFHLDALSERLRGNPQRSILAPSEVQRAERMIDPTSRHRFLAAHTALRLVLMDHHPAVAPGDEFALSGNGKPSIANGPWFSLSHTGDLCLVAIDDRHAIGVDAEEARAVTLPADWLARFPALAGHAAGGGPRGFLRAWVCLEAIVKRAGLSMAQVLDDGLPDGTPTTVFDLALGDTHVGAVAADASPQMRIVTDEEFAALYGRHAK